MRACLRLILSLTVRRKFQVLDDNMMLCLSNGERIRLDPTMRLLFEVSDLESASPATVSRLGVVYVAPDTVGWMAYVQSWLQVRQSRCTKLIDMHMRTSQCLFCWYLAYIFLLVHVACM